MGEAILGAAIEAGVLVAADVTVIEKVATRRSVLESKHSVHVSGSYEAMSDADVVLLSVKPQEVKTIAGSLRTDALLVSIMAGVTITSLREAFRHEAIARVMPNTPAAIGQGMSAWTATPEVSAAQRDFVKSLLAAIGTELYVDDEKKIDMVTAVSGSGPAYVFMFIEALVDGAVAIGLPRSAAEELVLQTLVGSSLYAKQSERSPAELRAMVTSPAGTTAAGLIELEKGAFRATVIECVRAAHLRAMELGKA